MASQSAKKLAKSNAEVLRNILLCFFLVNLITLASLFILKRPSNYKPYVLFSIPSFSLHFIIERNGRPSYEVDDKTGKTKLSKVGDDISRDGLYEYMFDVIYITWAIDILMILIGSNKVWWFYSMIPAYLLSKLLKFVLPFFKKQKSQPAENPSEQAKSKRQSKLEAKKGKAKVRYR